LTLSVSLDSDSAEGLLNLAKRNANLLHSVDALLYNVFLVIKKTYLDEAPH